MSKKEAAKAEEDFDAAEELKEKVQELKLVHSVSPVAGGEFPATSVSVGGRVNRLT